MNINKFTQKSMEAVQNCEKLAYEYGNQQIDQPHLLYSLLCLVFKHVALNAHLCDQLHDQAVI